MKPEVYLLPHGAPKKLQDLIYANRLYSPANSVKVSIPTIRQVCKGRITGVCSPELARIIYDNAPKVGGIRIDNKLKPYPL